MTDDKKSLYVQIVDYLIGMIENKEIQVGDRLPTELELMEKFAVSRITAKRALEELKNKGLIYRKKGHGSFLSKTLERGNNTQQKIISMIIPYENSTGRFIDYIRGAADYLYSKGYLLSINCTDGYENKERDFLISMSGMGVSGILYYPTNRTNNFDILSTLYMNDYPIVLIDKYFDSLPLSYSVSDNFDGGYKSCKHLIDLGHRNIAFMSSISIEKVSSVRERFLGYCKALKDNGLKITNDFILTDFLNGISMGSSNNINIDYTPSLLENLIDKNVTAVIAENDYIALDIMKALEAVKAEIPNDISLVGFDNISLLSQMNIQLTTIEQDFYEIGKKAAMIVVDTIEGKNRKQIKEITPIRLIERNSTGKALK